MFDSKKKVKLTNAEGVEYKLVKKQLQAIEFNKALLAMYTNQVSERSAASPRAGFSADCFLLVVSGGPVQENVVQSSGPESRSPTASSHPGGSAVQGEAARPSHRAASGRPQQPPSASLGSG